MQHLIVSYHLLLKTIKDEFRFLTTRDRVALLCFAREIQLKIVCFFFGFIFLYSSFGVVGQENDQNGKLFINEWRVEGKE